MITVLESRYDKPEKGTLNCDVMLGFNTKQWWVYDNTNDVFIDPPTEVLKQVKEYSDDQDEQEQYLWDLVQKDPDWLYDVDYWYDGEI